MLHVRTMVILSTVLALAGALLLSCDPEVGRPVPGTCADCAARTCQTLACADGDCIYTDDCDADHCINDACVACIGDDECDDSNDCTDDACIDWRCRKTNNTDVCDDRDACTEGDACAGGACVGIAFDCSDGDLCTDDVCTDGTCSNPAVVCANDAECDPATGDCVAGARDDLVGLAVDVDGDPVDFDDLTVGDTISITAPIPTALTRQATTCTCVWNVDPATAGTFSAADECETDFTVDDAGDFTIRVVVTCIDGTVGTFKQDGTAAEPSVPTCTVAADCDDGLFCNGAETCVDSLCVAGIDPCAVGETCNEDDNECVPGLGARRVLPGCYDSGASFTVTIEITPPTGTLVYGVEDSPPSGWSVSSISDTGEWDATNGAVKWFFVDDDDVRTLSYMVTPPGGASGNACFDGEVNFDGGANQGITGIACIDPCSGG